jgi:predicted Holliday junction resolvase-like endonuclease
MPDALSFLAGAFVAAVVVLLALWRRERVIRAHALTISRAVMRGQVSEQLAPLLDGFPYAAMDARFLGHPIDYVVFDGFGSDEEIEVVLVEVKTGRARLSLGERRVRDAVEAGRVRFEVVRLD